MPNGGSICCFECNYGRNPSRTCAIFGTEASPQLLCRLFRLPNQSNVRARKTWEILNILEAGCIYEIENTYPSLGEKPKLAYRIQSV